MTPVQRVRSRASAARAVAMTVGAALAISMSVGAGPTLAHGPDPLIPGTGTLWNRDQVVPFQWASGGVPPAWMATALDLGAGDVSESRNSRAAVFVRTSSAPAVVGYGPLAPCDSYGIACANRTGMTNGIFSVWLRPQGWPFDWGTLKWCQSYSTAPNGCFDAETLMLDELGHIEILGHHVNFADESDFTDAVVQASGHTKPRVGWNQHAYGRCDIARLQLEYERRSPSSMVSTCLALPTSLGLSVSRNSVDIGDTITFTATLKIAVNAAAEAMSGDPMSDRTVLLQRRYPGATTWMTYATIPASTLTEGAYVTAWWPNDTFDWRATFAPVVTDGVLGATSGTIRVTVSGCIGTGCPLAVTNGHGQ